MSSPAPVIATDRLHLSALIGDAIASQGFQCSLNHIDVSGIKNLSSFFMRWPQFNGDISQWNTSSAVSMLAMFRDCEFNGDISNWNVAKVESMERMFEGRNFNGDISKWNVSNVRIMNRMFMNSKFNGDLSAWNVSKVVDMKHMFEGTSFNQDISKWNVSSVHRMKSMFSNSTFNQDISQWNVGKVRNFSNMFEGAAFAHDISVWPLCQKTEMSCFCKGNSLFLAAQRMEPWIVGLYLENEVIPEVAEWAVAFANVQALALSLGLTPAEKVAAIVEAHGVIIESGNRLGNGETPIDNAVFEM